MAYGSLSIDAIDTSTGNLAVNGGITSSGTLTSSLGTVYPIVLNATVSSASGTNIDFTGIPNWAKRITVMFKGVSKSGTTSIQIQMITASGAVTTGYVGAGGTVGATTASQSYTTGFGIRAGAAADTVYGHAILTLLDSSNTWIASGSFGLSNAAYTGLLGGGITLASAATGIRITTTGADTFDAGSVNVMYE